MQPLGFSIDRQHALQPQLLPGNGLRRSHRSDHGKETQRPTVLRELRNSPAVPKHVQLYGFFYEMNGADLIEVVRDIPA